VCATSVILIGVTMSGRRTFWYHLAQNRVNMLLKDGRIVRLIGVKDRAGKFKIRYQDRHEMVWADDYAAIFVDSEWVRCPLWEPLVQPFCNPSSLPRLSSAEKLPEIREVPDPPRVLAYVQPVQWEEPLPVT